MDFTLYWFMFPVSILVATCAMLSGIGGAALFTPIFILVFPLLGPEYVLGSTIAAIATALITQTFGFLSGFIGYYRRKLIDYRLAARIVVISVPVAIAGALTAGVVHDSVLLASYALLVAVLSVVMWRNRPPATAVAVAMKDAGWRTIVDSKGHTYAYDVPRLGAGSNALAQMIKSGGWSAVPWNLLCYDIPGVLIGGQIGPRLQGRVSPHTMRRAISVLFVLLAVAMMFVALRKSGAL
jgi:uncharacterized membrane protein YfcA